MERGFLLLYSSTTEWFPKQSACVCVMENLLNSPKRAEEEKKNEYTESKKVGYIHKGEEKEKR